MPTKKYHKVKDGGVFACDVDDTIFSWNIPTDLEGQVVTIRANGFLEEGIPNQYVIEHIKKMKKRHYSVVIWSAGGSDWAEDVVKALGLEEYVDVIMPKIDFHMDDNDDPKDKIGEWCYIDLRGNVKRQKFFDGKIRKCGLAEEPEEMPEEIEEPELMKKY